MLAAAEPAIGGVLLRGQKGSAKTTLARGLARLLADDAPFVEHHLQRSRAVLLADGHGLAQAGSDDALAHDMVEVEIDRLAGGVN